MPTGPMRESNLYQNKHFSMCGAELKPLPEPAQRVMSVLLSRSHSPVVFKRTPTQLQVLTEAAVADLAEVLAWT